MDVDAMSSDGCPVQMLSEGECTIHTEMNMQPAFFGIRGFTASFNQVTMWLWIHFNSRMDTSSGLVVCLQGVVLPTEHSHFKLK